MEWVEGCRANDQDSMQQASLRPRDVAVLLLDVFAEMTYVHGFVHADPHPGNILVRPAPHQGQPAAAAAASSSVLTMHVRRNIAGPGQSAFLIACMLCLFKEQVQYLPLLVCHGSFL